MLELALEGEQYFVASDLENRRPGRSYSIETLKQLRQEFGPGVSFYFIVGMDSFLEITTWKNYRELFEQSAFAVMNRPGFESEDLETVIKKTVSGEYHFSARENAYIHPRFQSINFCRTTLLEISSTHIREAVAAHKSIRFLLPRAVERYILEEGLYKE
jgi:nicotinate-nucleotide adenylyltransferase